MQGPQGEAVLNVGGGEELGDNPGAGGGWKQEIRWDFSTSLSCSLRALKVVGVPRNHEQHGRVFAAQGAQSECYLGELSECSLLGHLCFSSA